VEAICIAPSAQGKRRRVSSRANGRRAEGSLRWQTFLLHRKGRELERVLQVQEREREERLCKMRPLARWNRAGRVGRSWEKGGRAGGCLLSVSATGLLLSRSRSRRASGGASTRLTSHWCKSSDEVRWWWRMKEPSRVFVEVKRAQSRASQPLRQPKLAKTRSFSLLGNKSSLLGT